MVHSFPTSDSPQPATGGKQRFTTPPPLTLYIHTPWCVRKCPYCDFNSHAADGEIPENRYIEALLADLEQDLPQAAGRSLQSIFIGGGTPSLFSARAMENLLNGIRQRITCAPGMEITLEANPGTAESERFTGYREAGINRLSVGVQSFEDESLQRIGRIHGAEEARQAIRFAREAGFERLNIDLMFGLPGQTATQSRSDVKTALGFETGHVSFYQLTLEPNTAFHRQPPPLPDDESAWDMQQSAILAFHDGGYDHYEVSAFARPGHRCRHNTNYWQFGDYLGIGAGAHGKVTDVDSSQVHRYSKPRHPRQYLELAGSPRGITNVRRVDEEDLVLEYMMNTLRMAEGFTAAQFETRTGLPIGRIGKALDAALSDALLEKSHGGFRATPTGRRFLNELLQRFMPDA